MSEDRTVIHQAAKEEVLRRCYHAISPNAEVFTRELAEAIGLTHEEFLSFVYAELEEESLVDPDMSGYDGRERGLGVCLSASGLRAAEALEPPDSALARRHREAQIVVLRRLAELRREVGPQGEMSYQEIYGALIEAGYEEQIAERTMTTLDHGPYFASCMRQGGYRSISPAGLEHLADHDAREAVRHRLVEVEGFDPQRKGKALEKVIADALRLQGCECWEDTGGDGEQIDLVVEGESGFYVCEAKWLKEPVEASVIDQMDGRLNRRAPVVTGVIFSMSGFSAGARDNAARHASHRTILLLGEADTRGIIDGERDFEETVRRQIRNLVMKGSL